MTTDLRFDLNGARLPLWAPAHGCDDPSRAIDDALDLDDDLDASGDIEAAGLMGDDDFALDAPKTLAEDELMVLLSGMLGAVDGWNRD